MLNIVNNHLQTERFGFTMALAVYTRHDDLLGLVAPVLLAGVHPTALVVDLDPQGIPYPGRRTLADLCQDGPTLEELRPGRSGVAVLPNGGAGAEEARPVLSVLLEAWPQVVLRVRERMDGVPLAEVAPLLPGTADADRPRVWVKTGLGRAEPGPGPVVEGPGRSAAAAVLAGRVPAGWRLRSWRKVWEWPWE